LIAARAGLGAGASAKKVSKSVRFSSSACSPSGEWPVSQQMIASTSARVRPLRSALAT
jgi:hypothetical protein